ncbi:sulfotransferase [Neobacillus sp. 179-C4.2 HS]|uniref:Sulfotransferase n=1 Tax=Neobacillus driksii TaxID=3035913 RepID=A0ABV4YSD9_9BACI|nr:sulfotransferase [Neobacillus sp. 179.-C4.2 HS]MDP5194099.1 sulfotransferase [Neobacillus sp. 179.-C4.2 HS]
MNSIIKKPIFLVGCMRSGTTILADLLGSHPNIIHCPFELRSVWSKAGNVPMASPKTHDLKCPCLKENDVQPGQAERLSRAFITEMKKNRGSKNVKHACLLNKNPHLANKLPLVNVLFPDSRFIWIYRDLPSVTSSLKKILNRKVIHYWPEQEDLETVRCWECFFNINSIPPQVDRKRCFPGGDIKYLMEYWFETNKAISDFSQTISSDRIFLIKEEQLIAEPENVLADCQSFLGIPINLPKMMINKIDRNRNELWSNSLPKVEIQSMLNFVQEQGDSLNKIFPEGKLFERYNAMILSKLFSERAEEIKTNS